MQPSNRYTVSHSRNVWRIMQGDVVISSFKQLPHDPPGRAEEFATHFATEFNRKDP
jgi:hypothetical protein